MFIILVVRMSLTLKVSRRMYNLDQFKEFHLRCFVGGRMSITLVVIRSKHVPYISGQCKEECLPYRKLKMYLVSEVTT